ncbi:MAG: hypothetical protein C1943_11835 [Halochromatium sp.]|nr:hypothetical protein [Halochromatium sp.]
MNTAVDANLRQLLDAFAARWNLGQLSVDEQGRYRLEVDGWLEIRLFQNGGALFLEGSPGRLRPDDPGRDDWIARILRAQLRDLRDREEVLTLDPEEDQLILFRRLQAAQLTPDRLEEVIEAFITQLERWTRELSQPASSSVPTAPPLPALQLFFP